MCHTIISIGELLWDMLPDRTILGGAPANLAFRLNELGCKCHLVSRIGPDKLGEKALYRLSQMGLPADYIQRDPIYPTGTVVVNFDENKNPDYVITPRVAYDHIEWSNELETIAQSADCIVFGTLAQRASKSKKTIANLMSFSSGAIKYLDINLRKNCYTPESIEQSLYYADILKANHYEALELNRIFDLNQQDISEICKNLSHMFHLKTILVTLEHNGVFLYDTNEGVHYIPGHQVILEDPLGAGDAFSAGFISAMLCGRGLVEACETGNLLGAIVASQKGATHKILPDEANIIETRNSRIYDQSFERFFIR